jgi:four helix bundle protein
VFGAASTSPMDEPRRDLEKRTAAFAAAVRALVRKLPRTLTNWEDARQLVRASGSVAANCIEANEALGARDRIMRFRISRKEAKECQLWLGLLDLGDQPGLLESRGQLHPEAFELKLILTAIIRKLEARREGH